jgi:hypothetical protein
VSVPLRPVLGGLGQVGDRERRDDELESRSGADGAGDNSR